MTFVIELNKKKYFYQFLAAWSSRTIICAEIDIELELNMNQVLFKKKSFKAGFDDIQYQDIHDEILF